MVTVKVSLGAVLTGSFTALSPGTDVDLTAEGSLDWANWGLNSATDFNRLASSNQYITNYTVVGPQPVQQANSFTISCSWTNGTPTPSASATPTAAFVQGQTNGFQFTVPANTNRKRLRVYAGALYCQARFNVSLSGGGTTDYSDFSLDSSSLTQGVYNVDFSAANSQTLTVSMTVQTAYDPANAAVVLQAATLFTNAPPSVTLTNPSNNTSFLLGSPISLGASASDSDGTIASVEFFDGASSLALLTNSPYQFNWTNASVGVHALQAVATDNLGAKTSSTAVTVFVYSGLGALSMNVATPAMSVDLAAEGLADWTHWGLLVPDSFDHKAGVSQQITNFSATGGNAFQFANNYTGYSWSGGTPTASATNTPTGLYIVGLGNGFQVTCAADNTQKTLKLYVGAYGAQGLLETYLSDFSGPVLFDNSIQNSGNGPGGVYTINFRAASTGQTLVARYTVSQMFDQSLGNVTLQAATLVGANNPPFASMVYPTNGSVAIAPASVLLQANASDSDGTISKVEFFQGTTKLGQVTNVPYSLLWTNVPLGTYYVTARATDNLGATFTSAAARLDVTIGGGLLVGGFSLPSQNINLTTEGVLDWGHWGLPRFNSFNHKLGGTNITGVSMIGNGNPNDYANNDVSFTWTNGTPTLATNGTTNGIFTYGLANGFQLTVPADRNARVLKLYVGLYGSRGHLEARVSDHSAPLFIDDSLMDVYHSVDGLYTLEFASASNGQTLSVIYTNSQLFDTKFGNVTWQAASLHLPSITLRNPHWSGGGFSFIVKTEPLITHYIEWRSSLPGSPWVPLTNFMGDGSDILITDPGPGGAARYYRVHGHFGQ